MDVDTRNNGQNAILQVSSSLEHLPEEILEILRLQESPQFLDSLSVAALEAKSTLQLFSLFECIFVDVCARWTLGEDMRKQKIGIMEAFARILPLAPHLSTYLEKYLASTSKTADDTLFPSRIHNLYNGQSTNDYTPLRLQQILLSHFRLLCFDKHAFSSTISIVTIQSLVKHGDAGVRYLAVRILCQLLSASDAKLEAMIQQHVGVGAVFGDLDGEQVDYGFLSLLEEDRLQTGYRWISLYRKDSRLSVSNINLESLSPFTVRYTNVLLPRPNGPPSRASTLVPTATTLRNMEDFSKALLTPSPILLHGLAGSGKTSMVNDFARELGVDESMVSLHLNEQTDAKMLIGMYATGSTPGSFKWRPGVLTTAVKEGRWVFIEDLDRAPNEVISVILPLIERGELAVPSRRETIKAGRGFKLLASIRTSLNVSGQENPPALHMLGSRLWQRVPVQMPNQSEFREIVEGTYPILHKFLPGIISVYERLYTLSNKPAFASRSRTSLGRPTSPRDLLKWCRRLDGILTAAGSKTGEEPITDSTKYEMFLEATDCFAGGLQTEDARKVVVSSIAEEMYIDPQRVDHFLAAHIPRYENNEHQLTIGRVRLTKRRPSRIVKSTKTSRPFANTTHAKRLLEQVGMAVKMSEPVLLVGETGIGKTTVVQQLADTLGFSLTAVNLSQQSEVGDLLGGFKPVNVRSLAVPLKDEFDELFAATGISVTKNQKYIEQLGKCVSRSQWRKASKLWREAPKMFGKIISELQKKESTSRALDEQPTKRRKTESRLHSLLLLKPRWDRFSDSLDQFDVQISGDSKGFAFTFVEGNIVKAARNGDWVLLDEINLASPETLEGIADLLHGGSGAAPSILLSETGEIERVKAHPNFRIFGAMNPATDVGKRDLPMGLRSRFTELYVESPDRNLDDLLCVIKAYLKGSSSNDEKAAHDVARLYLNTKRLTDEKRLVDGANQVPHFSLRTLTRVLSYVTEISPSYGLRRALYEGFAMGFLTLLNRESEKMLMPLINHHLLDTHGNAQSLLSQTPRHPEDGRNYIRFKNGKKDREYWMLQGSETPQGQLHYIITPFVERNMLNLVRATSTRRFPVLVQGPTSSGKTSMIEYLAKFSGNKFVRINNHEHTDLQEYLGTYISGADGQLRFQEGLLVQALRQGHWIVLDELNLAPTDVLEALNRLLDDNRELLIPETQETVRPHENFMLFATQNPPGLYGGRKTLSRAFRNRFLELHFDDIPEDELDIILEKRSQKVAPSDCRRIVAVYKELSRLRQSNRLFEQKDSFATLRDLFRWALRDADNREQLAANGYMLLAERVRNPDERIAVKEIIERVMKVKLDPSVLYDVKLSPEIKLYDATSNAQGVVWTQAMRRLYVLVAHALRNNEPVLLVGETGCGKTTVCQMLAEAFGKRLNIVNAHQNTETGDLIGAQRPVRNRAAVLEQLKQNLLAALQGVHYEIDAGSDLDDLLAAYKSLPEPTLTQIPHQLTDAITQIQVKAKALFEWSDGSLVQALKEGQFFLLDEISLADDSVLERLNSVLETGRTILLAEKGADDSSVRAVDGFQFFATMNPGGDYGKRELSPALRNRFTEIWVPSLSEQEDVLQIVETKLSGDLKHFARPIVLFSEWFGRTYRSSSSTSISVRDILAWIKFMNSLTYTNPYFSIIHGAAMVYIDTLGANPAALLAIDPGSIHEERVNCVRKLGNLLNHDVSAVYAKKASLTNAAEYFSIGGFSMAKQPGSTIDPEFAFHAPTTKLNAMRVLRALQVQKPILIEGSPGVGKTTLIAALAQACNRPLTRINFSEQTDLMDLFGSDVPIEGAEAGHFAWRDAPFLQAMQRGEWVLLDEMNLASQSVLEGLNACLDHRGEVYISELDQSFKRHPEFSVFAAQNPHHQGGGRKGLPASFVNRFTVVYADVFRNDDLELICRHNFPAMPEELIHTIISFVSRLEEEVVHRRRFGSQGGPWEFNLRDILRWLQLLSSSVPLLSAATPADFLNLVFRQRFRSTRDRDEIDKIFTDVFGSKPSFHHFFHSLSSSACQVGMAYTHRDPLNQRLPFPAIDFTKRLPEIESVMVCIEQNLPCIVVGSSGSGKTTLIQHIAASSGKSLIVFPLNSDIDTMDLVGGFEQVDPQRSASSFLAQLADFISHRVLSSLPAEIPSTALSLLESLMNTCDITPALFSKLHVALLDLKKQTSLEEFDGLAQTCHQLSSIPAVLENARFEWVDGVLVKALEQGDWLILDNANLCSASVLDRLNSLLEPNGFLSINEHCGPDGEPKIVRPHSDFRIFLTMDARFGELSRAMRNRAVEIFLEPLPASNGGLKSRFSPPEAALIRYQRLKNVTGSGKLSEKDLRAVRRVALENLAWADMAMLPRYIELSKSSRLAAPLDFSLIDESYMQVYQSLENHGFRNAVGGILKAISQKNPLALAFKDAQMIHPLQNTSLLPVLQQSGQISQAYWLAACFEFITQFFTAFNAQTSQSEGVNHLKPSKMNRLQRSIVKERVPEVAKDSTTNISTFLSSFLAALKSYIQRHIHESEQWKAQRRTLSNMLQFWWDTYNLATSTKFEDATFQAHLAIGRDLLTSVCKQALPSSSIAGEVLRLLNDDFQSGFKLTTGLSMEILWKQLRPVVIPNLQVMEISSKMEDFAQRFDALRWKTNISISELGAIMKSLVKAYRYLLLSGVDGISLVQPLSDELQNLETSIENEHEAILPFFTAEFEALRQLKVLNSLRSVESPPSAVDDEIIILANHDLRSEMRASTTTDSSRLLQGIDYLSCQKGQFEPVASSISLGLLQKLTGMSEVDMRSLKLLEAELPIMAKQLSQSTTALCHNQLGDLDETLSLLISSVVSSHGIEAATEYGNWATEHLKSLDIAMLTPSNIQQSVARGGPCFSLGPPTHDKDTPILALASASLAIAASKRSPRQSLQFSATAWVQFAIGCITLYVPDRAFDPDKRQRLEIERHQNLRQSLQDKISALQLYEESFTGQKSNLRIQQLDEDILNLGEAPAVLQVIYRPQISEMDQLQGEFTNLIKTVIQSNIVSILTSYFDGQSASRFQEIELMQMNVGQIIRRLAERFPAYKDITSPVISMLRCLEIGLSLATLVEDESSPDTENIVLLSNVTPFLGGAPVPIDDDFVFAHPIDYLALAATASSVESLYSFDRERRLLLFRAFHGCYEQWTKRLELDRLEAESKTGLYRFKGSAEDEEEEDAEQFNELFPDYESDSPKDSSRITSANSTRDTTLELASIHASIFIDNTAPSESILALIRQISKHIAKLAASKSRFTDSSLTKSLLPGTILLLGDQMDSLISSSKVTDSYNFYTDPHLPETRRLVTLIHQIQHRFRELQKVDEIGHMQPLEDVLVACRDLLHFRHTEPLAKIITKVEQVHTFIHEWQFGGWASRANSALTQYDDLTATIVSWRRLELSTWAKLFDMECKQCEDDARSWWFVAYQVVIAAPLQMSDNREELVKYARKLLQDLEIYFSSAIIGQIVQRLQLLKQLRQHLKLLMLDIPHMEIIHSALSNFISLYVRYEKPVQEQLKKGRVSLEKSMKDVLLMASWKDTNIVALRDSARRSHHKLFKIVRKFRVLLGQPMDSLIKQGLPEQPPLKEELAGSLQLTLHPAVDQSALNFCAKTVPDWSSKNKRFTNVSKTVGMMVNASQMPGSAKDGSSQLDSFLANIASSSIELQKATPSILTDDNKDEVKHLKTRKRKLFADALKELRQMGINYNLSVDALAKQNSLSVSLANAGNVEMHHDSNIPGLEYYFHKAIDNAPCAREAARQPSKDLSSAEVARSTGFLEGVLQVLLSQHNILSSTAPSIVKLETQISLAKALWAPGKYDIKHIKIDSNHEKLIRWLPNILTVGLNLIAIHSKVSKVEAAGVQRSLVAWKDTFEDFARQWDDLVRLPSSIISTSQDELQDNINNTVAGLQQDLQSLAVRRPDLAFILDQILPWASIEHLELEVQDTKNTIKDLDQKLSSTCDAVLVAIEKHKKALREFPDSFDEHGWFIKHNSTLASSIKSLHSGSIVFQIEESFDTLRAIDLSDDTTTKSAGAVFAVALPIFQQYLTTLQQSMKYYARLHRATCKASYILSKTFIQIASQGFCTPSEKSDAQNDQTEKLEGGTGLGGGEGAEDISKDIQDDENLDELAQEPNTGEKGEVENEQDAVDMADGEMEGEMGDGEEKESDDECSNGESQSGDEIDEEAGDVDDLDPTAVDEKMWDGDGEEAEKDQEGAGSKGDQSKDERVAAQDNDKQAGEAEEGESGDEEEMGADQGEEVKQDDTEKHDAHAQEGEALDLPDDMELDGDEEEKSVAASDDGMDDMSDVEQDQADEVANDGKEEEGAENADTQENHEIGSDIDVVDLDGERDEEGLKTEEAGEQTKDDQEETPESDNDEGLLRDRQDESNHDADNAVPSDVQGTGEDQDDNPTEDKNESSSKAQRDEGGKDGDSSEQNDTAAKDGEQGRQANGEAPQDSRDETQDSTAAQPFKKLGEALEKWHREQSKIRDPAEQTEKDNEQNMDVNPDSTEFQHLQDEEAQADTQALGTATEEQARALDESMALDQKTKDMPDQFQPDEVEKDDVKHDDTMEVEVPSTSKEQDPSEAYEGRAGAMIKQGKEDRDEEMTDPARQFQQELEEDVEEVDHQLESTHLDEASGLELRSSADAREKWTHYEALTRDLSLSLTEQLRLILAPTLATKMRGDFRTGKRLNIKRIIPYIASQYKRDKIWMRRSVPSKRSYQIMLAVDDSKSMGESGSGSLAFETLVMVSKSLSMLEVGEICVVGFGSQVKVAHDFDTPFSSDAGPKIFQNFGFQQSRTDVTHLIRESIDHFRAARSKSSSSPVDLWQMELIISDGVCDSSEHESIRRLLRQAFEERIMMVFVIVDDVRNKKKGESVMDLKEAKFVKDENTGVSQVRIERYLDTFPFQYYLIVSDVKELPGVLATLLRQWFAEVVDSSS